MDFLKMKEGDGRNQALFNYILTLQSHDMSVEECRECIRLINRFVLSEPLPEDELETILRDDSFNKPVFFNSKGTFLFDKFANFMVSNNHIVRIYNQLHIYVDGVYVPGKNIIEAEMIRIHSRTCPHRSGRKCWHIWICLVKKNTRPSDARYIAFRKLCV